MALLELLFLFNLALADPADGLEQGKITDESHCILCGGRYLCGAVEETLSIDLFDEKQTASLKRFCSQKNYAYLKLDIQRMPWVSKELKSFHQLKSLIEKVAKNKSKSKFTQSRIEAITDEKLAIRVQYRMKNGLPYREIEKVVSSNQMKSLMSQNKMIPVFSYETFKAQVIPSKKAYRKYLENLITAPTQHFTLMQNGYAHIIESSSRSPASYLLPTNDIKEKKSHEFYRTTDIDNFIKKISRYPSEFCEKMPYKEVMSANRASLRKISQKYGGQSLVEQNYYYKNLVSKFSELEKQNLSDCRSGLQTFINQELVGLPNPEMIQVINLVNQKSNSRIPSSIGKDRPVHCEFNINNYKEECN